eukprot:GHUV01034339.1.p2 GENE.GHUV01034339.1~~GHUV01034339.1.p2  ORF type:complete len:116 (+),score=6.74 GHUV01034339.1:207-554(+)
MPSTGTAFSCSAAQLASVAQLLGDQTRAEQVCSRFDVGSSGAQTAVLQYLAQSSSTSILETNSSLNTAFILFSGYLVFVMQCGFAMVSTGYGVMGMARCRERIHVGTCIDECTGN